MYKIRYNNVPSDISCGGVVMHDNNLTVNLYFKQLNGPVNSILRTLCG